MHAIRPDTRSAMSSVIPSEKAAVNPMIDQRKGMTTMAIGNFLSIHSSIPKVKIVVGQGSPKVGDDG